MVKTWKIVSLVLLLIFLVLHPNCSSGEECVFDITGTWEMTIFMYGTPSNLVFTFSGTKTQGLVSGLNYPIPAVGTYTVEDCTTVTFIFDYIFEGYRLLWTFTGTLTSATTMNGNISIYSGKFLKTNYGTWVAQKL